MTKVFWWILACHGLQIVNRSAIRSELENLDQYRSIYEEKTTTCKLCMLHTLPSTPLGAMQNICNDFCDPKGSTLYTEISTCYMYSPYNSIVLV